MGTGVRRRGGSAAPYPSLPGASWQAQWQRAVRACAACAGAALCGVVGNAGLHPGTGIAFRYSHVHVLPVCPRQCLLLVYQKLIEAAAQRAARSVL